MYVSHLVIEGLAVEVDECGIELDVVATPGREGGDLAEGGNVIAGACRRNVRLLHHVIYIYTGIDLYKKKINRGVPVP
jgi:hypothetical protein